MKGWGLDVREIDWQFKHDFGVSGEEDWQEYERDPTAVKKIVGYDQCWVRFLSNDLNLSYEMAERYVNDLWRLQKKSGRPDGMAPENVADYIGRKLVTGGFLKLPEFTMEEMIEGLVDEAAAKIDKKQMLYKGVKAKVSKGVRLVKDYVLWNWEQLEDVAREIYTMTSFRNDFLLQNADKRRREMYTELAEIFVWVGRNAFEEFRTQMLFELLQLSGKKKECELIN